MGFGFQVSDLSFGVRGSDLESNCEIRNSQQLRNRNLDCEI